MAKKRKRDKAKEEEYEFRPPDFDEKEFLKKELRDTKTVLFTIAYAIAMGVAAGLMSRVSRDLLGPSFLLVIAGIVSLKWVYDIIGIDVSTLLKKNWAGNIATYFFTFLAVWVLLLNPPFADNAKPTIDDLIVWVERPDGEGTNITGIEYKDVPVGGWQWVPLWGEELAGLVRANASYTINITAHVADNGGLDFVGIDIGAEGGGYLEMESLGEGRYGFTMTGDELTGFISSGLMFSVYANDKVDNDRSMTPVRSIPISA